MCDLPDRRSRPVATVAMLLAIGLWLWPKSPVVGQDLSVPPSDFGANSGNSRFADTRDFVHVLDVQHAITDQDEVVITLRVDPGFHVNANPASFEYLLATRVEFADIEPLKIIYPIPVQFKSKFADGPLSVYDGTIAIQAHFPNGVLARNSAPRGKVVAQACTDEVCLPPAVLPFP